MAVPINHALTQLLNDVPDIYIEKVIYLAKINETPFFKNYCLKQGNRIIYRDFILSLFNADRAVIQALYNKIEYVLTVAGCAPGVGIAFNVIDAVFCFLLSNWLGVVVAIISCFPFPGFKVAGKGLEKFLSAAIKKIPIDKIVSSFTRVLGIRIEMMRTFVNQTPYVTIQNSLRTLVADLNNPFAEEVMLQLSNVIRKFGPRLEEKTISSYVKMTPEHTLMDITKRYLGLIEP